MSSARNGDRSDRSTCPRFFFGSRLRPSSCHRPWLCRWSLTQSLAYALTLRVTMRSPRPDRRNTGHCCTAVRIGGVWFLAGNRVVWRQKRVVGHCWTALGRNIDPKIELQTFYLTGSPASSCADVRRCCWTQPARVETKHTNRSGRKRLSRQEVLSFSETCPN